MGYSSVTIGDGYHLFTATFEDCAGGEYDLNDVVVLNEDGTPWDVADSSTTACVIQKMTTDGLGKYDTSKMYTYRHYKTMGPPVDRGLGWYTGSTTTRTTGKITLKNGEGLSINNKTGKNIQLRFSGAVTLTGRSFRIASGYSLVGNLTPVEVNLNDVKILLADGTAWDVADSSTTCCVIQKMTTDGLGKYDTSKMYTYRHYKTMGPPVDRGLGWYTGSTTTRIGNTITIGQGEALSINNKTAADIIVEFPSPIAPKETPAE